MIKNFVKILELLGDRLEVCVSVVLVTEILCDIWGFYIVVHLSKHYVLLVIHCKIVCMSFGTFCSDEQPLPF